MITRTEDVALARCLRQIEQKIGWGSSSDWSTQDFERLAELIHDQTGISLSLATLKRVWGRVRYDSSPTATTLNTLVQFIGYENWAQFKDASNNQEPQTEIPQPELPTLVTYPIVEPKAELSQPTGSKNPKRVWFGIAFVVVLVGILLFFVSNSSRKPISPTDFSFSSRPVTKGLPNSVVFQYDATASPTDSVFIQQSWDPNRRQAVPKNGHAHTSIYYHPGYFRAKLVVGNQIVQEHNLMIPSDGWHVAVDQEPVPVYFKANELIKNGELSLPIATLEKQHLALQPQPPRVQYMYVREFDHLQADNFVLETRLKNTFRQGSSACQRVFITILCKNEFFSIPLSAKGCVGDLTLYLPGHPVSAKNTDLSGLGANLSNWVTLRCEVKNKQVQLFVNGRKAFVAKAPNSGRDIVGISYGFEGSGAVDFVRLQRPDKSVAFEDEFN